MRCDIRNNIAKSIGIKSSVDADGKMTEKIVFALKDLQNAVAHNNAVFDTRFCSGSIDKHIARYIETEISIKNITFKSIVDYVILITFMMKLLCCNKKEILAFIKQFEIAYEELKTQVPVNIYNQIIYTDTRPKLKALRKFL